MKKQLLIIISVAVASFLIGTMFSTNYLAMGGGKPNPVWEAIYDLQAKVNSLTNTVTEQQAQISELQTLVDIMNATKLGKPDYDSGWTSIASAQILMFTHNLGTKELLVYVIGKDSVSDWNPSTGDYTWNIGINQWVYGSGADCGNVDRGLYWMHLDETTIQVRRGEDDIKWDEVRVMLWKIPEP